MAAEQTFLNEAGKQGMSIYDQIIEWFKNNWISAVILLIFLVLMSLPRVRDGVVLVCSWVSTFFKKKRKSQKEEPIILEVKGETVTFTELLRSVQYDVVKVNAHTHALGVAAEYEWIHRRYPDSKTLKQGLTTLELIAGKSKYEGNQIHFDVIKVRLSDGYKKEIYFDISSFFIGGSSSTIDPDGFIAKKISGFYK